MEDYIGEFLLKSFVEFKDYRLKSFEKDFNGIVADFND